MKLVAIEHYKFMVCYHFVERERFVISLLEETFGCVCVCVCVCVCLVVLRGFFEHEDFLKSKN